MLGDVVGLRRREGLDPRVERGRVHLTTGLSPSSSSRPSDAERPSEVIVTDDSISVLHGTQSVSTQAPPRPSASTTVTSAPSWAATRAAS